jgi:hypothetical protein
MIEYGAKPITLIPRRAVVQILWTGPSVEPQVDDRAPVIGNRARKRPVYHHSLLAQPFLTSESFGAFNGLPLEEVGGSRAQQGSRNGDQAGNHDLHEDSLTALVPDACRRLFSPTYR